LVESVQNPERSKKLNPHLEGTMTEFWNSCEGQSVGSYLLVKHLSGFSNSAVYTAVSGQNTQPFAIKLLQIEGEEKERRLAAWSALLPLSHPHLIRVFEAGQCEIEGVSLLYLVMERADGDLASVLKERALTTVEARETLEPALEALTYLQERGYVYGGVEPQRVLAIGEEVKLSSDRITRSGQREGPRHRSVYDPPEWEAGAVSPEGDVWSLGATLVQALTQKPPDPLSGGGDVPVLASTPEPFLAIARNCLRLDPKSRWSLAQIDTYLHGPQLVSPPVRALAESETHKPRMSFYWIAAAVFVVITIFVLSVRNRTESPAPAPSQPAPVAVTPPSPSPAPREPETTREPEPAARPREAPHSSGNWYVVVATYSRREDAEKRVSAIERQTPELKAEVYVPSRSAKPYYLVVIGSNLSQKEAIDLRARAGSIAADAYLTTFKP
jgi:hypothetical protein